MKQSHNRRGVSPEYRQRLRDTLAGILSRDRRGTPSRLRQLCENLIEIFDASSKRRYIGVYGQQKAGKSTLFNSIIREEVLPVKAIPTTGSIIDLIRNPEAKDYTVTCCKGTNRYPKNFNTAEEVCNFLDKVATQKQPVDKVEVKAAFPHAAEFMTPGCILRDTPGAIANPDDAEAERLKEDSQKTLDSLSEVCIPIFCVSGEAIGSTDDKELYDNHLRDRFCLHVITHRDGDDNEEVVQDLDDKLGIYHDNIDENPIICTGKSNKRSPFVDRGLDDLAEQIRAFLDEGSLAGKMFIMAKYISECHIDGNLPWKVDVVLIDKLNHLVEEIENDEN